MGKRYEQLSLEDRCEIARFQAEGRSIRQIAAALDRTPSTIARELKRNQGSAVGYKPSYAQEQARARRWSGSRLEREAGLRCTVLERLARGWSPEQVAGRLAREADRRVISYESIYRFIYAQMARTKDYGWRRYLPRGKSNEASAADEAAAPQASSKAVFPWRNGLPMLPIAQPQAIGKPTSSCSLDTVRPCSPSTSAPRASSSPQGLPTKPPSGWRAISCACSDRCRRRCVK